MVAQSGLWLQPRLYPHRCSTGRGARLYPGLAGIACNLSVPRENRFGAEPFEFTALIDEEVRLYRRFQAVAPRPLFESVLTTAIFGQFAAPHHDLQHLDVKPALA